MSTNKSDDQTPDPLPKEVQLFWSYRGIKNRGLVAFGLAVLALIVFHNPRAWSDGTVATAINYAAWLVVAVSGLVIYWADVKAAGCHGYCRGKFGETPAELREYGNQPRGND